MQAWKQNSILLSLGMTRNWKRQLLFKARIKWIKWIRKGIIWSPFKNLLQLLLLFSWDLQEERIQRTSCVRQVSVLLQTLASLSEKESGIQIREIDKVKGENQQKEKEKERRRNTWKALRESSWASITRHAHHSQYFSRRQTLYHSFRWGCGRPWMKRILF